MALYKAITSLSLFASIISGQHDKQYGSFNKEQLVLQQAHGPPDPEGKDLFIDELVNNMTVTDLGEFLPA